MPQGSIRYDHAGAVVRVNIAAAGLVGGPKTGGVFAGNGWLDPTLARLPVGRLGRPAHTAGPVLLLASEAALWITGQALTADGGFTISG